MNKIGNNWIVRFVFNLSFSFNKVREWLSYHVTLMVIDSYKTIKVVKDHLKVMDMNFCQVRYFQVWPICW